MTNEVWRSYLDHGLVLTPIKAGGKRAYVKGWSKSADANVDRMSKLPMLNGAAGLCLAFGRYPILSVDIDDYSFATDWFAERGIDILDLTMNSVAIKSPAPNKGKLLFKLKKPVVTRRVMTPEGDVGIEFRCGTASGGTCQDVLPPSPYFNKAGHRIGNYEWAGGREWGQMTDAPEEIMDIVKELQGEPERELRFKEDAKIGDVDVERIERALKQIPPADNYDVWIKVMMAIHSEQPGEEGFRLFDEWSQTCPEKYKYEDCVYHWGTANHVENGITIGTLFDMVPKIDWPELTESEQSRVETDEPKEKLERDRREEIQKRSNAFLFVPGPHVDYLMSARAIFSAAQQHGLMYRRNGVVVRVEDGVLVPVTDVDFVNMLDELAEVTGRQVTGVTVSRGTIYYKSQRCSRASAGILLKSKETSILDDVLSVSATPFITRDGTILRKGFHPEYGVYVSGGEVEEVEFDDAVADLLSLFDDFLPYEPADMSRLMSAVITPALKPAQLVGHTPLNFYEADQSQAGKGLAAETPALIYGTVASNVKQRSRGAGSLEESIDSPLTQGKQFINLDNLRGRLDSQWFEGLLTSARDSHEARVAYVGYTRVDTTAVNWAITSNGMTTSADMVNRVNFIKLRKQPSDYKFVHTSKEGYHQYVIDNQPYLLGCVLAVVKRWIDDGQPQNPANGHTFVTWAGVLDYIMQTYFKLPPLMESIASRRLQLSDPMIGWARLVCLAVEEEKLLGIEVTASELVEAVAGTTNGANEMGGNRPLSSCDPSRQHIVLGTKLQKLFRKFDRRSAIAIDDFEIVFGSRSNTDGETQNTYVFSRDGQDAFDDIPF